MDRIKLSRICYFSGSIALLIGAFDPMEGSPVILLGSILLAIAAYSRGYPYRRLFLAASVMVFTGVSFLFYFSSIGGIGGPSDPSLGWGVLILPYPLGWLMDVALVIATGIKKRY